jgi:threonine/homoserine/homoserine lactone efflux protein
MIAGHGILELALVIALLLGLGPIFRMPAVFAAIALIGAVILFWMAFGMFRSLPSVSLSFQADGRRTNHPVLSGIIMSVANPYWGLWCATVGLGYIAYSRQFGLMGVGSFFAGHILADLCWYSLIAAAVTSGRRFLTNRFYRNLIAVCAAFLVLFGCYFAYTGLEKGRTALASWTAS